MDVAVVAASANIAPDAARSVLEVLEEGSLLHRIGGERYSCHPLVHAYAAERAQDDEPDASRRHVTLRMLTWYLDRAHAEGGVLREFALSSGMEGADDRSFARMRTALEWFDVEYPNIAAAVHQAAREGRSQLSWRLAYSCNAYFLARPNSTAWKSLARIGLLVARGAWDERGEAHMLMMLAMALTHSRRPDLGRKLFHESLAIWWSVADPPGACWALDEIGTGLRELGRYEDAADYLRRCRDHSRRTANHLAEARALRGLGDVFRLMERPQDAVDCLDQALAIPTHHE